MRKKVHFLSERQSLNIQGLVNRAFRTKKQVVTIRDNMRASSAGYCTRLNTLTPLYDKFNEGKTEDVTPDAALALYAKIGEAMHEYYQSVFFHSDVLLFKEFKLPQLEELNLTGRIDAIIILDGRITGVEIKSCGTRIPSSIETKHKAQAMIYSAITGLPFIVLYSSREVKEHYLDTDLKARTFPVLMDSMDTYLVMRNLFYSRYLMNKRQLAPDPFGYVASICRKCDLRRICKSILMSEDATEEMQKEAMEWAENKAKEFIANTPHRRNGILKHIVKEGVQSTVKKYMMGSWQELIGEKE